MAFVPDGHCLWKCGAVALWAGHTHTSYASASDAQAHSGTYSCVLGNGGHWTRTLDTARADLYIAFWFRPDTGGRLYCLDNDDNELISLRWDNPYWNAHVDGVKVASGAIGTSAATWQHIQVHAVIGDSGSIQTRIDGVSDISYNGDTKPGAATQVAKIRFYGLGGGGSYVDEAVWGTGGWPGDCGVDFLPVNSDISAEMTPSTGSDNYACVDERPPSDDDYVSTTSDATDVYGVENWDDAYKQPMMVTGVVRVKKADAGSDDKITLGFGDGVNTADGSAQTVLTSYEYRWHSSTTAPDGGAWSDTDVDNLQLRVIADIA